MASGVEVTGDTSVFDGLIKRLVDAEGEVLFGVFEDAPQHVSRDGGRVPMAQLAATHELGLGVPERSFLRGYVDGDGRRDLGDAAATALGEVVDGAPAEKAFEKVGETGVEGVRARMMAGLTPALKRPLDPERDQRGIPLVDTEQLIKSISSTWEGK